MMLLSVLLATSCIKQNTAYHNFQSVPSNMEWSKRDTLFFQPIFTDSLTPYQLFIEVRHTDRYRYQDLWAEISHNLADSNVWQKDTLRFMLCNPQGEWAGTGNATNLYVYTHRYGTITPKHTGVRKVYITSLMKDSVLRNISDIGINLIKP